MREGFNKVLPMQFFQLTQCPKPLEESAIEPLKSWIPSGMVWGYVHLLNASQLTKFPDGVQLKVTALIAE